VLAWRRQFVRDWFYIPVIAWSLVFSHGRLRFLLPILFDLYVEGWIYWHAMFFNAVTVFV